MAKEKGINPKTGRNISRKGLIKQNWDLVREIVIKRDSGRCGLCKKAGNEVDHCFPRTVKELFYDIRNLTLLCSDCHSNKTYRRYGMDIALYELVEEREGKEVFDELRNISKSSKGGFSQWSYFSYHEDIYKSLTGEKND